MKTAARGLFIILCAAGIAALMSVNASGNADKIVEKERADTWNRQVVDSAISLLKSGNIVLRMGLGADSRLLSLMNRRDKSYSHCGIVMIENGYPFVYHSIGGEDNPDERLRRDSAWLFFSPRFNTQIAVIKYDFSAANVDRLRATVSKYYHSRPKFDLKFDLATDDKLYCSEFVYKAITSAMNDTAYLHVTTAIGHRFVGIDDIFMNRHASIIWRGKFK